MRKVNVNSEGGNRERAGFFDKLRAPSSVSGLASVFRKRVGWIVGFSDSFIASKAWKFIPAAVLAASLGITAQLYKNEKDFLAKDLASEVKAQSARIENAVVRRIQAYEQLLMGIRGNFEASAYVSPEEFWDYVRSLKLNENHPEIKAVSASYYVLHDELDSYLDVMRKRGAFKNVQKIEKGFSEYALVSMIEPRTQQNDRVLWYDNFSNVPRRSAMERARDFDRAQMTETLLLAQNGNVETKKWVILFLPVYGRGLPREELSDRRRNVVGWIAASFFLEEFLNAAISDSQVNLWIRLYDSPDRAPESLVYDTTDANIRDGSKYGVTYEKSVDVLNREWSIVTYPTSSMESSIREDRPRFVLAFWSATSLLFTFFFWVAIHGRWSLVIALEALKTSSANLLISEKRHRALFKDSKVPMLLVDPLSGAVIDANDEAARYYGYCADVLKSMNITQISDVSHETVQERLSLVRHGLLERFETNHRTSSGEIRLVEVSASPIDLGDTDGILQIVNDITERKNAVEKIVEIANHDQLTGLPNRNLLMDRLNQAFANADRHDHSVALLFIDLDQFKSVNDSIGHDVGDLLLKEVACRMSGVVRAQDTVARMGGDEFLVILPDLTDPSLASVVAEKLISVISQPFSIQGHSLHIGASVGIASYPNDANDSGTLMKFADSAMYEVKNSGRNAYRFFSKEMHEASMEHQTIANALHEALERGELSVEYQPLVNVASGKTIGMEALLRWNNPSLGRISPEKFIPIAEDSGLIVPIGEWVVREVCQTIGKWKSQGIEAPRVAINLSARQFRLKTLVEDIVRVLEETGTDPQRIGLEITEGMLIQDVEAAVVTLGKLSALGLEVSIDDFWTGYSSLSYLKRFPVKKLKIDRSFVNDIVTDADDVVIVRSIVDLAHNLGLRVVAEWVETENQFEMLREMGCDCAQWYLFSRPITADGIKNRLTEEKAASLMKKALRDSSQILTTENS